MTNNNLIKITGCHSERSEESCKPCYAWRLACKAYKILRYRSGLTNNNLITKKGVVVLNAVKNPVNHVKPGAWLAMRIRFFAIALNDKLDSC